MSLLKAAPCHPLNRWPDVLPFPYTGNTLHPTQKPVEALQPLIESFSAPGAIVLDPFAGSGSTCVAAYRAGRRYIGIEMLAQYHRAGTERLAAMHRAVNTPAANGSQTGEGYIQGAGSAGPPHKVKTAAPATQRVMVLRKVANKSLI
ncbi:putative methylase [Klebsiella pneumoniae]|uniref:Putative methylase n=1 Tax=Klebsiella pneumoniae TaxID=573 RepID=A0A377YRE1_KLEPN|nr:putative methylase [Klebsiella pneumoniae]